MAVVNEQSKSTCAAHATNGANQAGSLDDFFDEMLVLEAVVYEDLELAAQVRWTRVKKLFSQILEWLKSGDV